MRWAMLPVYGFLQLEIYIHIHYMFPYTFYSFWSWFWSDRIQEYSLPYFLCHGSPPLSFGQADPPRSSKYWPCLDAAIPLHWPGYELQTFFASISSRKYGTHLWSGKSRGIKLPSAIYCDRHFVPPQPGTF